MLKAAAASLAVFGASVAWLMGGMFTAESAHAEGPLGGGLLSVTGAQPTGLGDLLGGATGPLAEVADAVAAPSAPPPGAIATVVDSVLESGVESGPVSEPKAPAPLLDLDVTPITESVGTAAGQPGAALAQVTAPVVEPVAGLLDSVTPALSPALQHVADLAGPTLFTLAPVSGPLATVLAPVTTPLATVLGPIVDPLAPVLEPVTGPLTPVLGPITDPLAPAITPIAPVIPAAQPPITGPAVPPPSPGQPNTPAKPAKPSDKPAATASGVPGVYIPDSAVPSSAQPRVPALSEPTLRRDLFIDLVSPSGAVANPERGIAASPRPGGTAAQFPEAPRHDSLSTNVPAATGPFAPAFVASASNALAVSSTSAGFFAALAATLAAGALLAVWRRVGLEWLVPPSLSFAPEVPPA